MSIKLKYLNKELKVSNEKIYVVPSDIETVIYKGFRLIISPSNGNWIVIENQLQMNIFLDIELGLSVGKLIGKYAKSLEELKKVLVQIEGKHFDEIINIQEESFPLRLYLTNNCNLRCKHCFMYASNELKNELSTDEIKRLIDKCYEYGSDKIIFTGGEVALKEGFIEILKYAKIIGMYTQVLTNGTLWTTQMINEGAKYIDDLQVSVDGYNEMSNARIRGSGVFDKALETVDEFIKIGGLSVSVSVTPLYDFIDEYYEKYIKFGRQLVEKYKNDDFLIIFGRELIDGRDINASEEKNRLMADRVDKIAEDIYPNNELTAFVRNHEHNRIFRNCGYGALTVNSNGDFYFCGRVNDVRKYGNIRQVPIEHVLEIRKKVREISQVDNLLPCKNCLLKYICGGGCRVTQFPQITQCDIENIDFSKIKARECSQNYINNFYRLMIESNDFLLW
ncbi:radical SAM protein [Clostridium sp. WILCCON 0269]|uniref:Radical SAM protein n=1 Tax=Candidatus Clostridium eludens TaxID=3381663 RepID=A0ABW8SEY7_9CLOT